MSVVDPSASEAGAVRTGKQAFVAQLRAAGVDRVFGNPGTTEQAFTDELRREPDIEFTLCLHEGVAVGAAEGYARAADRPGVVVLHTAAGLGNGTGMLANAHLAHTPLVVYVGDMPRPGLYQEPALSGPLVQMASPVSKWAHEVRTAAELPQVVRRAFKVAMQEPRGPVVLVVPADVMDEETVAHIVPPEYVRVADEPPQDAVGAAAELLAAADRPAILVADGVPADGAGPAVAALAETIGAAILQGYVTEVCLPEPSDLDLGPLPLFDPVALRKLTSRFDCVIAFGSEVFKQGFPGAEPPFGPDVELVHVGQDQWELGKNVPGLLIAAGPRRTAEELTKALAGRLEPPAVAERRRAVQEEVVAARARLGARIAAGSTERLTMAAALQVLGSLVDARTVIVDESVSAQPLVQHLVVRNAGGWFRSRGGGLGAGMSVPLGVALAMPDRRVVALVGDGSAMYTITSMWTAAHHGIPVVFVVLNNHGYRMLELNLDLYLGGPDPDRGYLGTALVQPDLDFVALAMGCGIQAVRATSAGELERALRASLDSSAPTLVEVVLDAAEAARGERQGAGRQA